MSELEDVALKAAKDTIQALLTRAERAERDVAILKAALEDVLNVTGDPVTIAHTALGRISLRTENL